LLFGTNIILIRGDKTILEIITPLMQNVLFPQKSDLHIFQITNDELENLVKCRSM